MPAQGKRRALGQHFLKDQSVIARIVDRALEEAGKAGCRSLLEIGPGRGALTDALAARLRENPRGIERLTLAERDRDLAASWAQKAAGSGGRLVVEPGDFLDLPRERWISNEPVGVVSNLPYSAATAIVLRLAGERAAIPCMVLMFQAEVARRLRATPETKEWGSLSIWIQNFWDVTRLCGVPPGAFTPPPNVDSEVVVLLRRAEPRIPVSADREVVWEKILRASFAHRRKMLRSGLPAELRAIYEKAGLDGTKRAEALSWDEWGRFFAAT